MLQPQQNKVKKSLDIIQKVAKISSYPLFINFSGGKDSLVLLDLVQRVTDKFICCYMSTGIEFPVLLDLVKKTAKERNIELLISYPSDYKGDFFKRLNDFGFFPTIYRRWCARDLKVVPQKKMLIQKYGKRTQLFKLIAIRRSESARRKRLYSISEKKESNSKNILVYPILDWTKTDRDKYLKRRNIKVETNVLYQKYGVSGCYWCPFYQLSIYKKILRDTPNLYDKFIEWEIKLNQPSLIGNTWIKNLKKNIKREIPLDKVFKIQRRNINKS